MGPNTRPRREELVEEGARVAEQYVPARILPQWGQFLRKVAAA